MNQKIPVVMNISQIRHVDQVSIDEVIGELTLPVSTLQSLMQGQQEGLEYRIRILGEVSGQGIRAIAVSFHGVPVEVS